jgi:hypothetical protein
MAHTTTIYALGSHTGSSTLPHIWGEWDYEGAHPTRLFVSRETALARSERALGLLSVKHGGVYRPQAIELEVDVEGPKKIRFNHRTYTCNGDIDETGAEVYIITSQF